MSPASVYQGPQATTRRLMVSHGCDDGSRAPSGSRRGVVEVEAVEHVADAVADQRRCRRRCPRPSPMPSPRPSNPPKIMPMNIHSIGEAAEVARRRAGRPGRPASRAPAREPTITLRMSGSAPARPARRRARRRVRRARRRRAARRGRPRPTARAAGRRSTAGGARQRLAGHPGPHARDRVAAVVEDLGDVRDLVGLGHVVAGDLGGLVGVQCPAGSRPSRPCRARARPARCRGPGAPCRGR